jgi:chemotaxis protein methyltransferase WspC
MHADITHPIATSHASACSPAEALLERWIGLDAHTVGSTAIARAVRVRMGACGETDEAVFLAHLTRDDAERDRFIDEVVVPESWFFRDPQIFDVLRQLADTFAASPGQAPLRILSAPCAAGEEPYSVALTLLEAGLSADQFRIDAIDVSHAALRRAAAASYSANAFRGADLGFRDRWFRMQGAAAELDESARKLVHFSWGNLLDESFAADSRPYDVIFCRNLLIYLTAAARNRVEQTLDRLLAPNGLLMLGAAEPPILKGSWTPFSGNTVFALQRGGRAAARLPVPPPVPRPPNANAPRASGANEAVEPKLPTRDELLHEAHELANAGRHAEAMEACLRQQQAAGPSAAVFFLMGTLYQAAGDLDRAEASLHKALYMDPAHEEAFLSLAVVATHRKDDQMAEHYRQSAARVRSRRGAS